MRAKSPLTVVLAILVILIGCAVLLSLPTPTGNRDHPTSVPNPPLPTFTITATPNGWDLREDDPGWDCHTMGNRICGPVVPTNAGVK